MTNKEKLQRAIQNDLNKEKNYEQIIEKIEKENNYPMRKWAFVPICLIILSLWFSWNTFEKRNLDTKVKEKEFIYINEVKELEKEQVDTKIELENDLFIPCPYYSGEITIPSDMTSSSIETVYKNNEKENTLQDNASSQLDHYNLVYFNTENQRRIKVSYSKENKPIPSYHFSREEAKESKIGNTNLTIYQYKNQYFTEFWNNGYYFAMETTDITEQELSEFLKSILTEK